MMYHRRAPVANSKLMTFGPYWLTSSTEKSGDGLYNRATPPWCWLNAPVATTRYHSDSRVYIPFMHFVSWKMPRSMLAWDIPRSADSSPPFRPFLML